MRQGGSHRAMGHACSAGTPIALTEKRGVALPLVRAGNQWGGIGAGCLEKRALEGKVVSTAWLPCLFWRVSHCKGLSGGTPRGAASTEATATRREIRLVAYRRASPPLSMSHCFFPPCPFPPVGFHLGTRLIQKYWVIELGGLQECG